MTAPSNEPTPTPAMTPSLKQLAEKAKKSKMKTHKQTHYLIYRAINAFEKSGRCRIVFHAQRTELTEYICKALGFTEGQP